MHATATTAEHPFVPPPGGELGGHPRGLYVLFGTEMWERLSYYGMRALLVLYMTKYLLVDGRADHVVGLRALQAGIEATFTALGVTALSKLTAQQLSSQIYGLYTGLVYLTPVAGGMLADRVLGQRKTVLLGGIIMALGHFLMAFEDLFLLALLTLIIGNGCFKPNISTQVGGLYAPDDSRRDRAFNIFYVGINVGAMLAPYICGTLGQSYGWHYGFTAAGVGMCIGLGLYIWGQRYLPPEAPIQTKAQRLASGGNAKLTPQERAAVFALMALCALNIVFWGVYEQQGNTLQLWADQQTNWPSIGSWTVPSTWYQSFNPLLIVAMTPLITLLWARQSKSGTEPSPIAKMAIGCFLLGASFLLMVAAANVVGEGRGSLLWLFGTTVVFTVGELYLSPVGLSLVTRIAPVRMVSMLMGMWLLSSFFGNYFSGLLGSFYEVMGKQTFFLTLCGLGLSAGAAMWAIQKPLERATGHQRA